MPEWDANDVYVGKRFWSLEYFFRECEKREFKPDEAAAHRLGWQLAERGGWCELLGAPPACCPRYPMAFATPGARAAALKAFKVANWSENGNLSAVTRLPLIPAMVDLVDLVHRGRARRHRMQVEEIKSKNAPKE